MRNFYVAMAAALMASAVASAQPAYKGLRFTPTKKNVVEAKKSGYAAVLPFGQQASTGQTQIACETCRKHHCTAHKRAA